MAKTFVINAKALESIVRSLAAHATKLKANSILEGIAITVHDDDRLEFAATDGYRLMVTGPKTIDGTFPNYQQIIPPAFKGRLSANLKDFTAALKGQTVDKAEGGAVSLTLNGKVTIAGKNTSATVPATIEHSAPDIEEERISLNRDYLLDAIRGLDAANEVVMEWNGPLQAVCFHADVENPSVRTIVMPIRD